MPILPKQCDIFPPNLLDNPGGPPRVGNGGPFSLSGPEFAADAGWIAFYTLSRREKDLMRKLAATAIPFYAPLIKRRLHSAGGRTRVSYVPLFPGYVFSLVDDAQRRSALATNTIARWLPIIDREMLLADLRSIKQLIDSDQPLTPEARLQPGQSVRVRSGALRGMEGTVVKRRGEERLVVAVRFLNQGASVELEDVDLERL